VANLTWNVITIGKYGKVWICARLSRMTVEWICALFRQRGGGGDVVVVARWLYDVAVTPVKRFPTSVCYVYLLAIFVHQVASHMLHSICYVNCYCRCGFNKLSRKLPQRALQGGVPAVNNFVNLDAILCDVTCTQVLYLTGPV